MNIMKRMVLALASAFTIFANTLQAQDMPLSFGIKAGGVSSMITNLGKSTRVQDGKDALGFGGHGGLFVSYIFHDYVGMSLEAGYVGLGSSTSKEKEEYAISTHNLSIPLMVNIYPMGYEPTEGILDIHLGMQGIFPLMAKATKDGDVNKMEDLKHLRSWEIGAIGGIGYEFDFGLKIEGRYNLGFMNIFGDSDEAKNYKDIKLGLKDKSTTNQFANITVGYNLAKLLVE